MRLCYVILLLLWVTAALGSVTDESLAVSNGGRSKKPRLIINPFGVFGNAKCFEETDEGRCNGLIECVALAGTVGAFCPGLAGPCCTFYRTCHQRTAQEVSYFRNAQWPQEDEAVDDCSVKILRRSDLFCGLRVQAEQGHLPTKSGVCGNAYVHIVGAGKRGPLPLCGRSSGIDYVLDFRHVEKVTVHVNSTSRSMMGWNIKLSQILCAEFGGETGTSSTIGGGGSGGGSVGVGGGGSTGGSGGGSPGGSGGDKPSPPGPPAPIVGPPAPIVGPPAPIAGPPAPSPPGPPAPIGGPRPPAPPPVTYSACGVKGSSGRRRRREAAAASGGGRGSSTKSWFRPDVRGPPLSNRRNKTPGIANDNPFIRDLEFQGPDVNDSVFHYFKGEDSVLTNRVTYGANTSPREYPWQVAMFLGSRYHCGASIIGDWFILTAAHCVDNYKSDPRSLKLSIGDWDLSNDHDGAYIEARVASVRVHPRYARTNLQNDLAVLKLTAKLDYTERIRPVCLPTTDIPTDGRQATITGWGRDENQRLKTTLQELTADITTNKLCNERWQSKNAASDFIVDTMMCMDASNGDSCNGDSGGPSVMEHPRGSGKYMQVGIVSFGSGSCTDENLPGVYTRVAKYRDWIRQQMY